MEAIERGLDASAGGVDIFDLAIDGLGLATVADSFAAIEQRGYRLLEQLGAPYPSRVHSTGGGAANAGWQSIREAALGVPVCAVEHQQAAYGAALLARQGVKQAT